MKLPYYVVKPSGAYWQPTKAMREAGFAARALGPDGPAARATADRLSEEWRQHRLGITPKIPAADATSETVELAIRYPPGSIGEAFQRFIRTAEWAKKAPGTRNKIWWPAWTKRIRPVFGSVHPDRVTLEDLSRWREEVIAKSGIDVAHKALKVWRSLWKVLQSLRATALPDPSAGIRNDAPKPREQRWTEGEVVRIVKHAWRRDRRGLAAVVAAIWDTSFQPGDVRTLKVRHLALSDAGLILDRRNDGRAKTGAPALGTLSPRSQWLLVEYLTGRGVTLTEEADLFATPAGRRYRDDTLADDFAAMREELFPGDRRQMRDMRRSGASEAVAGLVDPAALAAKLANSINRSDRLWKTYVKIDAVAVRAADDARKRGRAKLRSEPPKADVLDLQSLRRRSKEG